MLKNETYILQHYFFEYVKAETLGEKQAIIEDCKEEVPSSILMIDRLKNAIDKLNAKKETKIIFINKVFDITKNTINIELLENMENQNAHNTTYISTIKRKKFTMVDYKEFEKVLSDEEIEVTDQNDALINNNNYVLNKINDDSSCEMNYLISKLLGYDQEKLLFLTSETAEKFIISEKQLPKTSNQTIQKEESLCDTKSIWLHLENILSKYDEKKKFEYVRMIFLDIITNQNNRILRNGVGVLESDVTQNDYYILDGKTLKKECLIESLLKNYYDMISDISDLINDNYQEILDFIDDLSRSNINIDIAYLNNLRENIKKVNEKRNIKIGIQKITENYVEEYSENRKNNNENIKVNIDTLRKSLGLKEKVLTKSGYVSILTIVLGIITCGFFMAYLMLIK